VKGTTVFMGVTGVDQCLDSPEDGTVNTGECNGGNFQRWEVLDDGSLRNVATGLCLTDYMFPSAEPCDGQGLQQWEMDEELGELRNRETGLCLNNSPEPWTSDCTGGETQRWSARPQSTALSNGYTSRCLDGRDDVITAECDPDSDFQQWEMVGVGTLVNVAYGRCLGHDAEGRIFLEECEGNPPEQQLWNWMVAAEAGNGPLGTADTGECLDGELSGEVELYPCDDGDYQRWETLGDVALP
jgi:hypothetical protein